jgi:hypothetical protein
MCYGLREAGEAMSDDLSNLAGQSEGLQESSEKEEWPPRSRWCALIASLAFLVTYFPLRHHSWIVPISVAVSYSVMVFAIALGFSMRDADDFLGDPRVPRYTATLLLPHAPLLALITLAAWLWLRAIPTLPPWWNTETHYGSPWQLFGMIVMVLAGVREGNWMAGKIRRQFTESDN